MTSTSKSLLLILSSCFVIETISIFAALSLDHGCHDNKAAMFGPRYVALDRFLREFQFIQIQGATQHRTHIIVILEIQIYVIEKVFSLAQ